MNQRLYLLNQLRKQRLDIRGLTQIVIGLVIARFHYALPAIAGQISVNGLHRIDAVFAKAFRWQRTSRVPSAADIVVNAIKNYSTLPSTPPIAYTICFHPTKMLTIDVHASQDMVEYYPWQKPNAIRTASSLGVCIAMLSISQALCYSPRIFINIIIVQHIDFLITVKHISIILFPCCNNLRLQTENKG